MKYMLLWARKTIVDVIPRFYIHQANSALPIALDHILRESFSCSLVKALLTLLLSAAADIGDHYHTNERRKGYHNNAYYDC